MGPYDVQVCTVAADLSEIDHHCLPGLVRERLPTVVLCSLIVQQVGLALLRFKV